MNATGFISAGIFAVLDMCRDTARGIGLVACPRYTCAQANYRNLQTDSSKATRDDDMSDIRDETAIRTQICAGTAPGVEHSISLFSLQ